MHRQAAAVQLYFEVTGKVEVVHAAFGIKLKFFGAMKDAAQDSDTASTSERLITAKDLETAGRHLAFVTCAPFQQDLALHSRPCSVFAEVQNRPAGARGATGC